MQKSRFLQLCSNCFGEITSEGYLMLCGTNDCIYKLCSRKKCQYIVNNIHNCVNYVNVSILIDEVVVSETDKLERTFDEKYNDDYVSIYRKSVDNNDD